MSAPAGEEGAAAREERAAAREESPAAREQSAGGPPPSADPAASPAGGPAADPVPAPAAESDPPPAAATPHPLLVRGELACTAWAIALLITMFALKWYGVDGIPGRSAAVVAAIDAWNGLTVLSRLILLAVLLTAGSIPLHLSQRGHGTRTDTSVVVAPLSTVLAAALADRVLIDMPDPRGVVDQKLGALIGLGCAIAWAASAWVWVRHARAARRLPPEHHRARRPPPSAAAGPS